MKMRNWFSVFGSLALAGMLLGCEEPEADMQDENADVIVAPVEPADEPILDNNALDVEPAPVETEVEPMESEPIPPDPLGAEPATPEATTPEPATPEATTPEPATPEANEPAADEPEAETAAEPQPEAADAEAEVTEDVVEQP